MSLHTNSVSRGGGSCPVQTGITANTGSTQATGETLTVGFNNITVCANAGDSVTAPAVKAGDILRIKNSSATSADVFPAVGDFLEAGSVDAAAALAGGASITYIGIGDSPGTWELCN